MIHKPKEPKFLAWIISKGSSFVNKHVWWDAMGNRDWEGRDEEGIKGKSFSFIYLPGSPGTNYLESSALFLLLKKYIKCEYVCVHMYIWNEIQGFACKYT